jgi:L-fuconolactonase
VNEEPMPFVDAHVHFWDPDRFRYRWLDGEAALRRPYLPSDLKACDPHAGSLVVVQADCAPEQAADEVAWFEELARQGAPIDGIVAHAPLEGGPACREALARLTRCSRVVGVRRLLQDEPPGFALQPEFVKGVQRLPEHGLTFDLCIRHHQLDEVVELVRRCPEVTFVLDHLAKPDLGAPIGPWAEALARLAAHPRVHCKLSGLRTQPGATHPAAPTPYLHVALEAFGPERCLYGSDWPVLTTATTYRAWSDTVTASLASLDPAERGRVMRDNAVSVYGLGDQGRELWR